MRDMREVPDLADVLRALVQEGRIGLRQGVVAPGGVHTGPNRLDILVAGDDDETPDVKYLDSYSPTAGDTVWMLYDDGSYIVVGKLA